MNYTYYAKCVHLALILCPVNSGKGVQRGARQKISDGEPFLTNNYQSCLEHSDKRKQNF